MEASYREYHKTAFTAATVHRTEAAQEAQRMRTAVCSLVGLRPPPPPTEGGPGGGGGGKRASTAEVDGARGRVAGEGAEGGEAEGGEEVRTVGVTGRHIHKVARGLQERILLLQCCWRCRRNVHVSACFFTEYHDAVVWSPRTSRAGIVLEAALFGRY